MNKRKFTPDEKLAGRIWADAFLEATGINVEMDDETFKKHIEKMMKKLDEPRERERINAEIEKIIDPRSYIN